MSDDPWAGLSLPPSNSKISALRVDPENPWGFFWARDISGSCLLVLRHSAHSVTDSPLPALKGVDVSRTSGENEDERMLVFRLLESSHKDIFQRLCRDIVGSTSRASTEREALGLALARTWRWHHLLRGGGDGLLNSEEQKGLIGELIVLERFLLGILSPVEAVAAWRGPFGSPKDFEIGRLCIEAKARRGNARPFVQISSEFQLAIDGTDCLFLHVIELDRAPALASGLFTVADVSRRIRNRLEESGSKAVIDFDAALAATGFDASDDYDDFKWVEGATHIFEVVEAFPKIAAPAIPPGLSDVKYCVSLSACEPFAVAPDALWHAVGKGNHGH
jgi:hypothetical protein